MNEMPPSPVSPVAAGAVQVHELFMAYVNAGFTRAEALQLTMSIMHAGMKNMNGGSSA